MLICYSVIFLCVSIISAKPSSTSLEAIKLAILNSFNGRTNLLHVTIQARFEENKFIFIDMFDELLKDYHHEFWDFHIQIDVNNEEIQTVGDYNLWFIDSYESFQSLKPLISDHAGDFPVFYLIFLKTRQTVLNLIERLFAEMLSLMVVNVNVVVEDSTLDDVVFYTYSPYRQKSCHTTTPFELVRFSNNSSMMAPPDFYPAKGENLHGCTLKIATRNPTFFRGVKRYYGLLETGGLEIAIIKELAKGMNFKVQLIERNTFEKVLFLKNGTAFGTYNLILNDKAHIMIGFFKHGPLQDRFVTPSSTYFFNWVAIALWRPPYTFRKYSWLFILFDSSTWFWCLGLLILATMCVFITSKLHFLVKFLHLHPYRTKLTNVLSMALGLSIQHLPTTNFIRFCFIVWSMGTLTIRATYEGKLFDSYRSLTGAETPLTVRQLLAQNYTIYSQFSYSFVLTKLAGIGNFAYKKLPIKKVLGNGTRENNAVIASFVYMYEVYDPEEMENMIIEPLFYEHVCLFMKKHSILAPKVNDIIERLEEAGLFNCWREHYEVLKTIHFSLHKVNNVSELGPISLHQFKYTLLLFAGPISVAIVVFVFELFWERIKAVRFQNNRRCTKV